MIFKWNPINWSDYLMAGWNWVHNTDVLYFHTYTRFTQNWPLIFRNDESNVHTTKFYWKLELKCRHWHNTAWIEVEKKIQIISYQQHNNMTKSYALWCDPYYHYHILWAEPFLSIPLFISEWIDIQAVLFFYANALMKALSMNRYPFVKKEFHTKENRRWI